MVYSKVDYSIGRPGLRYLNPTTVDKCVKVFEFRDRDHPTAQEKKDAFFAIPLQKIILRYSETTQGLNLMGKSIIPSDVSLGTPMVKGKTPTFWVIFTTTHGLANGSWKAETERIFGEIGEFNFADNIRLFYNRVFAGTEDEPQSGAEWDALTNLTHAPESMGCCHILLVSFVYDAKVKGKKKQSQLQCTIESAVSFNPLPLHTPISDIKKSHDVGVYIHYLATSGNDWSQTVYGDDSLADECSFRGRGLSTLLLTMTQAIVKDAYNGYKYPYLFATYSVTDLGHEPAICFWGYHGFLSVEDQDYVWTEEVSDEMKSNIDEVMQDQVNDSLVLAMYNRNNGYIGDHNPRTFCGSRHDEKTLLHSLQCVIFPKYDLPPPMSMITSLHLGNEVSKLISDPMKKCLGLKRHGQLWTFRPNKVSARITAFMNDASQIPLFSGQPPPVGCENIDVYTIIGRLFFGQKCRVNDPKEDSDMVNLSCRFRQYMSKTYNRMIRHGADIGVVPWLPQLWSCIQSSGQLDTYITSLETQEAKDEFAADYGILLDREHQLLPSDLWLYGQLIVDHIGYKGSLLDLFVLFQLHHDRSEATNEQGEAITFKSSSYCIHPEKYDKHQVDDDTDDEDNDDDTVEDTADNDNDPDHTQTVQMAEGANEEERGNHVDDRGQSNMDVALPKKTRAEPKNLFHRKEVPKPKRRPRRKPLGGVNNQSPTSQRTLPLRPRMGTTNAGGQLTQDAPQQEPPRRQSAYGAITHGNREGGEDGGRSVEDGEGHCTGGGGTDTEEHDSHGQEDDEDGGRSEEEGEDVGTGVDTALTEEDDAGGQEDDDSDSEDSNVVVQLGVMARAACEGQFKSQEQMRYEYLHRHDHEDHVHVYNKNAFAVTKAMVTRSLQEKINRLQKQLKSEALWPKEVTRCYHRLKNEQELQDVLKDLPSIHNDIEDWKEMAVAKWNMWKYCRSVDTTKRAQLYLEDTLDYVSTGPGEDSVRVEYKELKEGLEYPLGTGDNPTSDHIHILEMKGDFQDDVVKDLERIQEPDNPRGAFVGPCCSTAVIHQNEATTKNWSCPISKPTEGRHRDEEQRYYLCIGVKVSRRDPLSKELSYLLYTTVCNPATNKTDERATDGSLGRARAHMKMVQFDNDESSSDCQTLAVAREFVYVITNPAQHEIIHRQENDILDETNRRDFHHIEFSGNIPIIPEQQNQLIGLLYTTTATGDDQWKGLFTPYMLDQDTPNEGDNIIEEVSMEWLQQNFSDVYLQKVKEVCRKGRRRYCQIPPGNARADIDMSTLEGVNYSQPIKFRQGSDNVCFGLSLANALFHSGYQMEAHVLAQVSYQVLGDLNPTTQILDTLQDLICQTKTITLTRTNIKCGHVIDDSRLETISSTGDVGPAVVILKDGDGSALHAVTIHQGVIFDSNCTHTVACTQSNLNVLAGKEFLGVTRGTQLTFGRRLTTKRRLPGKGRPKKEQLDQQTLPVFQHPNDLLLPSDQMERIETDLYIGYSLAAAFFHCGYKQVAKDVSGEIKRTLGSPQGIKAIARYAMTRFHQDPTNTLQHVKLNHGMDLETFYHLNSGVQGRVGQNGIAVVYLKDSNQEEPLVIHQGLIHDARRGISIPCSMYNLHSITGLICPLVAHGWQLNFRLRKPGKRKRKLVDTALDH